MMIEDAAITFWDVVKECLVEFHKFNHADAHSKAMDLRHRLRESDRPKDMVYPSHLVYHEEPFYIACNLADRKLELEDYGEKYRTILGRHGW
jgi:hypothetical protein